MNPSATSQLAEVSAHRALNAEYRLLELTAAPPATTAAPGQFFQLLCPATGTDAPFLRRPMSVYAAEPGIIRFLYKITGAGTRGLASLRPGDRLDIFGPLGVGFSLDPAWNSIVAIGRGAGLATLAPLARACASAGIGVTAILSARRPELMVSDDVFAAAGARVITVTDHEGTSGPAHVERLLRGLIAAGQCDAMVTCGSTRILKLLQRLGAEHAIPGQVALEQQMACGLGMCFCCVKEFREETTTVHRRVCIEGPVFNIQDAIA